MVFILFKEVIIVQISLILVCIEELCFEQSFIRTFYEQNDNKNQNQKKSRFWDSFKDALKILFKILYYSIIDSKNNNKINNKSIILIKRKSRKLLSLLVSINLSFTSKKMF